MATGLAERGNKVEIAALHPDFENQPDLTDHIDGVPIRYVAPMHVRKIGNRKQYHSSIRLLSIAIRATLQLFLAAIRSKPDLIFAGKPHPMNGLSALLAGRVLRIPFAVDCDDYEAASSRFSNTIQRKLVAFCEKWIPRFADCVITNTHFNERRIESYGVRGDRIHYLPNGVDQHRFSMPDLNKVRDLRKRLSLGDAWVIGYIGTLSEKSHPVGLLLDAFEMIYEEIPLARLLIVGGGEVYAALSQHVEERGLKEVVVMAGRVPAHEVPLYYQLCDVSVEPVLDDDAARGRSPLKLFESWASGVPFITGDVGDRREILGDPMSGILYRAGDPKSLAQELRAAMVDKSRLTRISSRGKSRVTAFYWSELAKELDRIMLGVISSEQGV